MKNPDSHIRDTGFCIIHEQLRNSSTHYKWDKASDGVVLQYSETTDYSTICGTRGRRLFLSSELMSLSSIAASDRGAPRLIRDGQP